MINRFSKIALAATLFFALAFTISCSDNKDEGSLDGSLDGTWQRGKKTIEINGTSFIVYQDAKGTINYNGSSATTTIDFNWDGQKWHKHITNFNYTLSTDGKTLTISDITGYKEAEKAGMNGDWTKKE